MMPARTPSTPAAPPPLLSWRERARIEEINTRRADLKARIAALPRCAHRRIILQAQLEELTRKCLAAEIDLRGGGA